MSTPYLVIVSIKAPDAALFGWLCAIDISEAAGLPPWAPGQ